MIDGETRQLKNYLIERCLNINTIMDRRVQHNVNNSKSKIIRTLFRQRMGPLRSQWHFGRGEMKYCPISRLFSKGSGSTIIRGTVQNTGRIPPIASTAWPISPGSRFPCGLSMFKLRTPLYGKSGLCPQSWCKIGRYTSSFAMTCRRTPTSSRPTESSSSEPGSIWLTVSSRTCWQKSWA